MSAMHYITFRIPVQDFGRDKARAMVYGFSPVNWVCRKIEYSSLSNNLFALWSFSTEEDKAASEEIIPEEMKPYRTNGMESLFTENDWTRNPNFTWDAEVGEYVNKTK